MDPQNGGGKASAGTSNRLKIRWTGVTIKDSCRRNTEVGAVRIHEGSGHIRVKFGCFKHP